MLHFSKITQNIYRGNFKPEGHEFGPLRTVRQMTNFFLAEMVAEKSEST